MKTYKLVAGTLLAASILMPSFASAAMLFDWGIPVNDGSGNYTDTYSVPTKATSTAALLGEGATDTHGKWYFLGNGIISYGGAGSGAGFTGNELLGIDIPFLSSNLDVSSIQDGNHILASKISTTSEAADIAGLQSQINAWSSPSQIQADYATTSTSSLAYIKNKPTLSPSYEGTTLRSNSFPIFKSATVASGVAVFNFTADGTSGGTSLCTGGVIQDSVSPQVSDATASYQMGWAWSNSNKTLTVTTNKLTTANILTGLLGQAAANASTVKVGVWCYA